MRKIFFLATLAALLAACAQGGLSSAEQTAAVETQVANLLANQAATNAALVPTAAEATATTEALAPLPVGAENFTIPPEAGCLPIGTERLVGTVTDVWTGDEIEVEVNGVKYDVRYIGIDATNMSADANKALVMGKPVLLVRDVTDVDQYGRLPRYVLLDGVFVNLELIRQGAALVSLESPDLACAQTFKAAKQ